MVRRYIKQGGQLIEESKTAAEVQDAPLQSTPLAAQIKGASPDAAKMVGGKANRDATTRRQIKSSDTLQRHRQTEDQRLQKQLGTADAEYVHTVQRVSNLPTFQKNIQAAAVQHAISAGASTDKANYSINQATVAEQAKTSGLTVEAINLALNTILNTQPGQDNLDAWNTLAKAAGNKSPDQLTWDDVAMFVPGVADIIGDTAKQVFGGEVKLGMLPNLHATLAASGFDSVEQLAQTLGTSVAAVQDMTVSQLNNVMLSLRSGFDTVSDLRARINDPALGANERTEIRKRLRELGVTGVRSLEAKANDILAQVEDGDTIEFAGEQLSIEEILDDDYLSGRIMEALTSDEVLAKLPKELQDYIASNRAALEAVQATVGSSLVARKQIIEDNRNIAGGAVIDALLDKLLPGWNDATGGRIDPAGIPKLINTLKAMPNSQVLQAKVLSLMNLSPEWAAYLKDADKARLEALGFTEGADPEAVYTSLIKTQEEVSLVQGVDIIGGGLQKWISDNFGTGLDDLLTTANAPWGVRLQQLFDLDGDKVVTADEVLSAVKKMYKQGTTPAGITSISEVKQTIEGGIDAGKRESARRMTNILRPFGGTLPERFVPSQWSKLDGVARANLIKELRINPLAPDGLLDRLEAVEKVVREHTQAKAEFDRLNVEPEEAKIQRTRRDALSVQKGRLLDDVGRILGSRMTLPGVEYAMGQALTKFRTSFPPELQGDSGTPEQREAYKRQKFLKTPEGRKFSQALAQAKLAFIVESKEKDATALLTAADAKWQTPARTAAGELLSRLSARMEEEL